MNRIMIGIFGAAMMASAGTAVAAPWVKEQATVPTASGARYVALIADRQQDMTAVCGDRLAVDETFQPQAVRYDVAPAGHGREKVTEHVRGIERIIPVAIASCRMNPGDHFDAAVQRAERHVG